MASRGKFRNQGNNANKGGNSKSPKKTGKPAQSGEANENDYEAVCDEIISSLDTDDQPPALKSLAKELSAIILPAITQVIESSIESKAVSKALFETLKASVRLNRYETDRLEQYTRRENIRIFNLVQQDQKPLMTLNCSAVAQRHGRGRGSHSSILRGRYFCLPQSGYTSSYRKPRQSGCYSSIPLETCKTPRTGEIH